jgi:hypothetical protein
VLKIGHFWKVDQKYMKSFEMWCWRRMEDISWTDCVKNKYHIDSRRKGASYVRQNLGKLMGLVTFCVGTVLKNKLLKKNRRDGETRTKTSVVTG